MKQIFEIEKTIFYTTGAFIQPVKLTRENGREVWLWVVTEFDGDTFHNGIAYNPKEYGDTKEELTITESEVDNRL